MGHYLKQQQFGYSRIIIIVVTDNPIIGIALLLIPLFSGDSTIQEGEGKEGK